MMLSEDIFSLACSCTDCSAEERQTLQRLCAAAETLLRKKLRKGVSVEDCYENFVCAAAFLAAADLTAVCAGTVPASFSAGDLSVSQTDGRSANIPCKWLCKLRRMQP